MNKTVIFCVDARIQLTTAEQDSVKRYKLGNQVIYNSEASKRQIAKADQAYDGSMGGSLKALGAFALASMQLNITINGLQEGQHIECKSLEEVIAAEEALIQACQNLKAYLATAAKFDGREAVINFDDHGQAQLSGSPA